MRFTIGVKIDTTRVGVKKECLKVLARYLEREGYIFEVGYDPREIDVDNIGKA